MNDIANQLHRFYELNPSQFGVLKTITISQGDNSVGVYEQRISLVMIRAVDDDRISLYVEFYGVINLSFSQPEASVIDIHLNILDGSAVPDEGCVFFVHDAELDGVIRFGCREFEAYKS